MRQKPTVAIIGCGKTGQALLDILINKWHVLLIDKDNKVIATLIKKYSNMQENVSIFHGDATSYYFLNTTGIQHAYEVLICVGDDNLTSEIANIIYDRFKVMNIIVKMGNIELSKLLQSKGICIIDPSIIAANYMINSMKTGESIAAHVGKGEGEILQIQLTSGSPIIGKPLKHLSPKRWLIGAVYRPTKKQALLNKFTIAQSDKFIIPSGETRLKVGDKILLIGDPVVLKASAQYLKSGSAIFPTRYGDTIVLLMTNQDQGLSIVREYKYLVNNMTATDTIVLYNHYKYKEFIDKVKEQSQLLKYGKQDNTLLKINFFTISKNIHAILKEKRIGLIIIQEAQFFMTKKFEYFFYYKKIFKKVQKYETPIWFMKSHPLLKRVTVIVFDDSACLKATELAIDVALKFNLPLRVIQILPSFILTGKNNFKQYTKTIQYTRELRTLYNIESEEEVYEGASVLETLKKIPNTDLLVIAHSIKNKNSFLIPHITKNIIKNFSGSQLIYCY